MNKKRLTREALSELAKRMPILSEETQRSYVGGGDGTFSSPYTFEEYLQLNCPKGVCYFDESGEICQDLHTSVISVNRESGSNSSAQDSWMRNPMVTSNYYGIYAGLNSSSPTSYEAFNNELNALNPYASGNENGYRSGNEVEYESGNESNPYYSWGVLGLNTAGDIGQNAEFILDDRGKYMPRGKIYTLNRPITVRLMVGNLETTSQVLNVVRVGGKYLGILGNAFSIRDIYNEYNYGDKSTAYWKTAFTLTEAGCSFIPGWGWAVSLGLGVVEQFIFD